MSELLHFIHICDASGMHLARRFYDELLVPSFPDSNELDPWEYWEDMLTRPRGQKHLSDFDLIIAFDKQDTELKTIVAGVCYEYFIPSNCYLLTYLVINEKARGKGHGVPICIEAWRHWTNDPNRYGHENGCEVVFMEAEDPRLLSPDSPGYLEACDRLRAFQQMGVRRIPGLPFVQPALGSGEALPTLLLGVVVTPSLPTRNGRAFVKADVVRQFLIDYNTDCGTDMESEAFKKQIQWTEGKDEIFLDNFDIPPRHRPAKKLSSLDAAPADVIKDAQGRPVRILVLGSGLSGLSCASDLKRRGFAVSVLEARHRIGGRVYTSRSWDTRIDLGCAWLHGTDGNSLSEFLATHLPDVKLYPTKDESIVLRDASGAVLSREATFEAYMKFLSFMEAVDQFVQKGGEEDDLTRVAPEVDSSASPRDPFKPLTHPNNTISLLEAIKQVFESMPEYKFNSPQDKVLFGYFLSQLEGYNAAPLGELSALHFEDGETFEGGDQLIVPGYHVITGALAKGVDVHIGQQVKRIAVDTEAKAGSASRVKVYTQDGECHEAHAVVCTLPLGVLQHKDVEFEPRLPSWKTAAIDRLGSGVLNKIVLRFDRIFWEEHSDWIGFNFAGELQPGSSPDSLPAYVIPSDSSPASLPLLRHNSWLVNGAPVYGQPILIALVTADLMNHMKDKSDSEMVDLMMARLRVMYGPSIPSPVDSLVARWDADPFARGSYTFIKKGASRADIGRLAEPLYQCLFFAGEATSHDRFSYADGAFASGLREAERIAAIFKPSQDQAIRSKL